MCGRRESWRGEAKRPASEGDAASVQPRGAGAGEHVEGEAPRRNIKEENQKIHKSLALCLHAVRVQGLLAVVVRRTGKVRGSQGSAD